MLFTQVKNIIICLLLAGVTCFVPGSVSGDDNDSAIRIELREINTDSMGVLQEYASASGEGSRFPPQEDIKEYPRNYTVKETFWINLQKYQYLYNLARSDRKNNDRVIKVLGQEWFDDARLKYTGQPVDCIVSVCVVESPEGGEYIIFDADNDENFSNDRLLTFRSEELQRGNIKIISQLAESDVEIEFYDGSEVRTRTIRISIVRNIGNRIYTGYAHCSMMTGELPLDGKLFTVGLIESQDIEYRQSSNLWIDTNQNRMFDPDEDYYAQVNQPFTVLGRTYQVVETDRFGNHITIRKVDLPSLEVGLPAPDFKAVTMDSTGFNLAENKGKYILLDFWGTWCAPCVNEIPVLKEAYDRYGGKKFEIVSIGVDDEKKLYSFIHKNNLKWTHIRQDQNGDLVKLYRIDHYPTKYLIDPQGILAAKLGLNSDELLEKLDRIFH
ncbi:TlpA family protein disulfide reductase [bacterium]|nr:TlpA family protein disulfide reductase [bacterium]